MEITINEQVYQFIFGMGFLREMNRRVQVPVDNVKGMQKGIGLRYMIGSVMDGEVEALVEVLYAANQGQTPRVTKELLDSYIDDPNTDIDQLFEDTLGFLKKANATKKTVQEIEKAVAEEKEKQKNLEKVLSEISQNLEKKQ